MIYNDGEFEMVRDIVFWGTFEQDVMYVLDVLGLMLSRIFLNIFLKRTINI